MVLKVKDLALLDFGCGEILNGLLLFWGKLV